MNGPDAGGKPRCSFLDREGRRVIIAYQADTVGVVLLEQRESPAQVTDHCVGGGEVVPCGQDVRVVLAEDADAVSEVLLEQRDGPAQRTISESSVVLFVGVDQGRRSEGVAGA